MVIETVSGGRTFSGGAAIDKADLSGEQARGARAKACNPCATAPLLRR
ncbi:MAG TPA: hypothetical protein VIL72_13890 [Beijerinckiaceae bacterium]